MQSACQKYKFYKETYFVTSFWHKKKKKVLSLQRNYQIKQTTMTKKTMMLAVALMVTCYSSLAQTTVKNRTYEDYEVLTNQEVRRAVPTNNDTTAVAATPDQPRDYISTHFQYLSMCSWPEGEARFMVMPDNQDLVTRAFTDKNNMPVSTNFLRHKVLIYNGHSRTGNSLHERVDFYVQGDPSTTYHFELPTSDFYDYCNGRRGVPSLAYLGDVDLAIDSLVGKRVQVLSRHFFQDSPVAGGGIQVVDIGDKRGQVMTITKAGIGTRQYPVKIVIMDKDSIEYFQYVAISRTNSGLRDDEFERSDHKEHSFRDIFTLLADRREVSPALRQWLNKTVYITLDTSMKDENERDVRVQRLSVFTVTDIFTFDDTNKVTLTLKGKTSGKTYTKEVSLADLRGNGRVELLDRLFAEGDPETIPGVKRTNMNAIRQGNVQQGFTEAEVRLALGEPSDITTPTNGQYQWIYQYVDTGRPFRSITFSVRNHTVRNATR